MKSLYILSAIVCIPVVASSQPISQVKYFEGIIEYDLTSKSYMQGVSDNEIRERVGSRIRFYFKDGNYMREYIDGAGFTIRKLFYRKDKNMMYDYNPILAPDTLYYISAGNDSISSFKIQPGQNTKVLDCECPSSVITTTYMDSFLQDSVISTLTYFFCPALPVNPEWHKDIYIWNEVIKTHKSIAIKFIEENPLYYQQTSTATAILWQSIDPAVLNIDPALILRPMPRF